MKKMIKFLKAFSLVELMISLIVISLISAAFAPVITKKISNNITTINSSNNGSNKGSDDNSNDVSECEKCEEGYYPTKIDGECACVACKKSIDNCAKCKSNIVCEECEEGFTLQNKNMCMPDSHIYYTYTDLEGRDIKETGTKLTTNGETWKIEIYQSGYLTFNAVYSLIDVFLVGAGGAGSTAGGGGGYTKTENNVVVYPYVTYPITVGEGTSSNGGATYAFGNMANGGSARSGNNGGNGGSGGGTSGYSTTAGGTDGRNGVNGTVWSNSAGSNVTTYGGKGQGSTTKEFSEQTGKLYSSGSVSSPAANTGHGSKNGNGASGIVVIRGKQVLAQSQTCKIRNCNKCEKSDYICDACNVGFEIKNGFCYTDKSVNYTFTDSSGNDIKNTSTFLTYNGNLWKLKVLRTGKLTFINLPDSKVDIFLVGAGGKGGSDAGGGGGYTLTQKEITIENKSTYDVTIGGFENQKNTSAFGYTANSGADANGVHGGSGGSGGGAGGYSCKAAGSDGGNGTGGTAWSSSAGSNITSRGGTGQGSTTREFGENGAKLYSSGGACLYGVGAADYATGMGGSRGSGGSGILVIRGSLTN